MIRKILSSLMILSLSLPSYAGTLTLKLSPDSITQGKYMKVDLKIDLSERPLDDYFVHFDDKKFPLFRVSEDTYRAYIGIAADFKPGKYSLDILNQSGKEVIKDEFIVNKGNFATQHISYYKPKLPKNIEAKIAAEDKLVDQARALITEKQLWEGPFILPVPNRVNGPYGTYRYLNGKYNGYHSGVDFASPYGTPIKAINNAKVSLARYFSKYNSNGNIVFLDHGAGVGSAYIHLSKISVKEGDFVKKGQVIGYVGSTGRSTGPHLHWGTYLYGQNTDGVSWVNSSKSF